MSILISHHNHQIVFFLENPSKLFLLWCKKKSLLVIDCFGVFFFTHTQMEGVKLMVT